MLQQLSQSSSIVALQGICDCASEFWVMMELCSGGDLEAWLGRFPGTAHGIGRQLLEAVQHLHSLLVCHLDLRPRNVLLTDAGRVRLCGFAHARQLVAEGQRITGICGSEGFQAPEVFAGGPYCGILADIYSLGMTMQVVTRADATWQELPLACSEMVAKEPQRRPDLATVYDSLFSDGWAPAPPASPTDEDGATHHPLLCSQRGGQARRLPELRIRKLPDLRRLRRTSSRATSARGTHSRCGQRRERSGESESPSEAQERPKLKRCTSSVSYQAYGEPRAQPPARLPPVRGGPRVPLTQGPLAALPPPRTPQGGLATARFGSDEPEAQQAAHIRCGSALCRRLGSCLCHDRPPDSGLAVPAATGIIGAPSRSRSTPGATSASRVATGAAGSMELLE
mmetsp:Transcript_10666/g.33146  ORF Transcript_10666/g.33146 Transcript_10666/m.33146 type:complete len:397 (+) Transcript_10666:1048-2238(+)